MTADTILVSCAICNGGVRPKDGPLCPKCSTGLQFDEAQHAYYSDGRRLPSVTQIIGEVIHRKFYASEWHMNRGSMLHEAIHLHLQGVLDPESVDSMIQPRLDAATKFIKECNVTVIECEKRVASAGLGYAGTVDCIARIGKDVCIVDWKSTLEPQADLQLGGYALLLKDHKITKAVAVELRDNGSYSCRWLNQGQLKLASRTFLALLTIYGWMTANNIQGRNQDGNN